MSNPLPGSFIAAMKHFFGFKTIDGKTQTLGEFSAECKELSDVDRAYFSKHLRPAGYPIPE